ncbi:hypothetical protein [Amycolatopsis sp. NPDC004079]|uniref:hypothetical protein n=1 Tax=Amycolatopsis sp. NPDC004079 TaxID=3154549 RepID=UPI0033AA0439
MNDTTGPGPKNPPTGTGCGDKTQTSEQNDRIEALYRTLSQLGAQPQHGPAGSSRPRAHPPEGIGDGVEIMLGDTVSAYFEKSDSDLGRVGQVSISDTTVRTWQFDADALPSESDLLALIDRLLRQPPAGPT